MAVVIAANRVSPIVSPRFGGPDFKDGSNEASRDGDDRGDSEPLIGRHLRTASTEALQGWTWRGYENITRMTMAALPMVELMAGASAWISEILNN